jgi:phosphatidylinositol alpha-mannosyltransferase
VRELAPRLAKRGHHVVVLAPIRDHADEPWVAAVGRPVDIPYNASNAPIDPRPWSRRRVRAVLERFAPDVVHAHEPLTPSTSMWATLESPAPVVATFHSGASRSRAFDLAAPALRRVARRLAVRIAVSEAAAAFARDRIGGAFEIVPNGVDVRRFAEATPADLGEGTKLLFVGRLDERKGFPIAVEAFARLAADRPGLRLVVAGDGPDRSAADGLAADLRDRITFLGSVPNRDLPPIHAACDLYLGTSVGGESFGIVLVEAMSAGACVVASSLNAFRQVLADGEAGLLFPVGDAGALADTLCRALADPDLRARTTAVGSRHVERYDWPTVAARILDVYAMVVRTAQQPVAVDPRSRRGLR